MIIYNFDFLLFLIYKRYYFNIIFNIRLINEFKSDKLLNLITDPLIKILHPHLSASFIT
jgi:hypothetical protein